LDALGGYQELAQPGRLIGAVGFLGMLLATAALERLQFQLKAAEASKWWASNGRDVVNAVALGAMAIGLRVIGFTGPIALSIAATLVLVLSAAQTALEKRGGAGLLSVGLAVVLGAPVLLAPRPVHELFRSTLEILFPL